MKYKVFAIANFSCDHACYAEVAKFLETVKLVALTTVNNDIVIWYNDFIDLDKRIRNDINRGSKIRVGMLQIPTFLPPTPPRMGEAICGVK